ncbi:hypothetical protein WMY93_031543 [Mugilogobius chulae]|uniref:Uncharacterized protein n=1 Tax=Mugilogobius chulae TaxID=88201 RepID=A0AAW0MHS0_9GOBI
MATAALVLVFLMGCLVTEAQLVSPGLKLRVRVNVTEDTVVFHFLRPDSGPGSGPGLSPGPGLAGVRLEGHIVVMAVAAALHSLSLCHKEDTATSLNWTLEPKYLVSVQAIPESDLHPHCTEERRRRVHMFSRCKSVFSAVTTDRDCPPET